MSRVKQMKRMECLRLVRASNRMLNKVRYSNSESFAHVFAKQLVCEQLERENKRYVTEAIFKGGGRADVLVLDDFEVIEIVQSEREESIALKKESYPDGLKVRVVYAKEVIGQMKKEADIEVDGFHYKKECPRCTEVSTVYVARDKNGKYVRNLCKDCLYKVFGIDLDKDWIRRKYL